MATENWVCGKSDSLRSAIDRFSWVKIWWKFSGIFKFLGKFSTQFLTFIFHFFPRKTHECHNKLITDFMFLGSCSLVATGLSSNAIEHRHWLITFLSHFLFSQPVTAPKARTLPSGTRCCRRKRRWLLVSFRESWKFPFNFLTNFKHFSFRLSRSRRIQLSLRTATSTSDISRKERWRVHIWRSSENFAASFPGSLKLWKKIDVEKV